jgi:regulatory protein
MKRYSLPEAKSKIQRYCAFQERSHAEVRRKLFDFGLYGSEVEEVITELITTNFLNEERYAKAFAGGKFRMKHWGRIKIKYALEAQHLSANCIRIGLKEISDEDYLITLTQLLTKKADVVEEENLYVKRDRLSKYATQKGYEPELVWKVLKEILPDQR